jgi:hypothetical protein
MYAENRTGEQYGLHQHHATHAILKELQGELTT